MRYFAISITAKERAELVEVAAPETLGTNEVRGRTLFTLVSPGTELAYNYTGTTFPSFPGYAPAFVAEELGAEVKGISVGDVCFCMGSHRSFQRVDAKAARPVPEDLPHHSADFAPHSIHSGFETALRWLADGRINTENLICRADPREAQSAYQVLLHRKTQGLFSVFDWGKIESQDGTDG